MATQSSAVPVSDVEREKGHHVGTKSRMLFPIVLLRFLTFGATLSAFVAMITDKQSTPNPFARGGKSWSKYHYSDAFMWFVVANAIAFVYALLTGIVTIFVHSPKLAKALLMLDLIVTYILMSAASAATAIAYVGKRGISEAGWAKICGTFGRYCNHVVGALVASFVGWLCLTVAAILSAHEGFRKS